MLDLGQMWDMSVVVNKFLGNTLEDDFPERDIADIKCNCQTAFTQRRNTRGTQHNKRLYVCVCVYMVS